MKYKNIILISISLLLIFISVPPVFAEVPMGVSWTNSSLALTELSGSVNAIDASNDRKSFTNYSLSSNYSSRQIRIFLNDMYSNINQPVTIWCLRKCDIPIDNTHEFRYSNNMGPTHDIYNYDNYDVKSNDDIYAKVFRYGQSTFTILFVPYLYLVESYVTNLGTYDALTMRIYDNNNNYTISTYSGGFAVQYIGCIDLTISNLDDYLDNMSSSLVSIDNRINQLISILQNQQSSSDATQVQNDTSNLHNQIDIIQNNNINDVQIGVGDILVNPLFNLNNQGALAGAGYIANIATNIFNSMGVLSWLLVFSGFISIVAYIMGRVGILYK